MKCFEVGKTDGKPLALAIPEFLVAPVFELAFQSAHQKPGRPVRHPMTVGIAFQGIAAVVFPHFEEIGTDRAGRNFEARLFKPLAHILSYCRSAGHVSKPPFRRYSESLNENVI